MVARSPGPAYNARLTRRAGLGCCMSVGTIMSVAASPAAVTEADPRTWDRALSRPDSPAPLLQSWAWGDVQAAAGWSVERLQVPGEGPVTVLLQGSGMLRWAYVPRGPVACGGGVLEGLLSWARGMDLARLRVEPEWGAETRPLLQSFGFRPAPDTQPRHTRILSLGPEEAMLASFRPGTRYNIRLAEKRGVTVEEGADAEELARQVAFSATRNGVRLPGRVYFQTLLERLPSARTFVARHQGQALAAILVAAHDGRGYYLFSGSNGQRRELKAVHAAMWAGIRHAAAAGCRDYDLWGIPPDGDPTHPWHGFGEFKRGFGGAPVEYAGAWDLILSERGNIAIEARERALRRIRRLVWGGWRRTAVVR